MKTILKNFLSVILAFIFALSINLLVLTTRAMDPGLYKEYLVKTDFYTKVITAAKNSETSSTSAPTKNNFIFNIFKLPENFTINPAQLIIEAYLKNMSTDNLRQITEANIDNLFLFLTGKHEIFSITTKVQDVLKDQNPNKFFENIQTQVRNTADKLPACNESLTGFQICIPSKVINQIKNFTIAQDQNAENNQIKEEISITDTTDNNLRGIDGTLKYIKEIQLNSTTILAIGFGLSALLGIFIILLSNETKLKAFGQLLTSVSISTAIITLVLLIIVWVSVQPLAVGGIFIPASIVDIIKNSIVGVCLEIQTPVYFTCLGMLIVGILINNFAKEGNVTERTNPQVKQNIQISIPGTSPDNIEDINLPENSVLNNPDTNVGDNASKPSDVDSPVAVG